MIIEVTIEFALDSNKYRVQIQPSMEVVSLHRCFSNNIEPVSAVEWLRNQPLQDMVARIIKMLEHTDLTSK